MRILLSAILLIAVAACASPRYTSAGAGSGIEMVESAVLPAPTNADLAELDRPYHIGPFDKLKIGVFGVESMENMEIQADASGRISIPLVGVVEAAGKTPGELAAILEDRLRQGIVRNPQVTVNLIETVSQVIAVDGEVREPGLYPVVGRMTLMRAIARASGTSEFARLSEVTLFRTVSGRDMAAIYDLRAIRRGVYADPEVYANDVVIVGNSPFRRTLKDVLAASPLLTAPLILFVR